MPTEASTIDEPVSLIIAAGGGGVRVGSTTPKQFVRIKRYPICHYAAKPFLEVFSKLHIIVACPKEYIDEARRDSTFDGLSAQGIEYVVGGATRFHSVKNALQRVPQSAVYTFVHDAARCFVSTQLIRLLYQYIKTNDTVIPYVVPRDSTRIKTMQGIDVVDREAIYNIQTPQLFRTIILRDAYEQSYQEAFTDDATVVESAGISLTFVKGEYQNIKITYPQDLAHARLLLSSL